MTAPSYRSHAERVVGASGKARRDGTGVDRGVSTKCAALEAYLAMETRQPDDDVEMLDVAFRLARIIREELHREIPWLSKSAKVLVDSFR